MPIWLLLPQTGTTPTPRHAMESPVVGRRHLRGRLRVLEFRACCLGR